MVAACATRGSRPRPERIESCTAVYEKVRFRDQFFEGLKGKATVESNGYSVDAELALYSPGFARAEVRGPFGMSLGLLILNEKWLQLFVPREASVYRFPATELAKDTLRRERFLKLLPIPLVPDLTFEALLTRTALPATDASLSCDYDRGENVYRIRVPASNGGRIVWVDPADYSPLKVFFFDRALPKLGPRVERMLYTANFSRSIGAGAATLPRQIEVTDQEGRRRLRFLWQGAEGWKNPDPKIFEWEPPASAQVHDF